MEWVLIVEDSKDDTLLLIRGLKKGGYNPVPPNCMMMFDAFHMHYRVTPPTFNLPMRSACELPRYKYPAYSCADVTSYRCSPVGS